MSNELIAISTPDGVADAYVTTPDDVSGPMPGVLFIVDAIGLRPQTKAMADRIASWGYVVLAPNVFYRNGTAPSLEPIGDLTEPENRATFMSEAMSRVKALTVDLAERDLSVYIDALRGRDDVRHSDIGITGYCMGGRLALLAAATRPDAVGAIGIFHTGGLVTDDPDSPHHLLPKVRADLLAIHADEDRSLPPEAVATFEHALTSSGVSHSAWVHAGAHHGFTMADTAVYHPQAAEEHFERLHELFTRTLR
ncbi:MAG: dienelactone hydrolase family protein [Actinomycetota bacterium]|nr:dienelactone hydrolase family protein [Actinomycetota bacterium]